MGTHLNVSHDAPTPVGMKVWAEAEITAVPKRKDDRLAVSVDEKAHRRRHHDPAIITNDRFLSKCNSKLDQ